MAVQTKTTSVRNARKKRTKSRAATKAARYNILLRIVKAANDKLDPSNVIRIVMDNIQKLIPCEAWSILMLSEEEDELRFERARGKAASALELARLKVGEGIAGWVAQHRVPVIVNDVSQDPRFNSSFDQATQFKTHSILCAPLVSNHRILGVVELINKHSPNHRFARQDLQMLTTLLGPIAVSLHNALLFKETEKLVVTDDLTKLYNNRFVNQFLEEMIEKHRAKRKKFAILFLDLDGFKSVNDCYGHMVGGRTLVEVGNVIFHTVRKDDLVARYGGDEFIVMMPNAGIVDAVEMAETIRKAVRSHDFTKAMQREIRLSASLGVSVYPDHGSSVAELIQKADRAMYGAKNSGKNAVQLAQ